MTLAGSGTGGILISGSISDGANSGNLGLVVNASAGTITLSGSNTYTGGTTITAGTLVVAANAALSTGSVIMNPSSGTAVLALTSASPAVGSLTNNGAGLSSVVLGNAAGTGSATTIVVGGNNASTTFSGIISDLSSTKTAATGALDKVGAGTLTLTANNTFTGGATVNVGTLVLQGGNGSTPAGTTTLTINVNGTVIAAPGYDNQLGLETQGAMTALNIVGGTFLSGNNEHVNSITMTGGLLGVATGAGQVSGMDMRTFSGVNPVIATQAAGATATISSLLTLDAPTTVSLARGTGASDLTITGGIDGTGSLTEAGSGILVLTTWNSYTGGTIVNGGTLTLAAGGNDSNGSLPSGQPVTINAGGTVLLAVGDALGWYGGNPGMVTINGGILTVAPGIHDTVGYDGFTLNAGTITSQGAGDATGNYIFDGTVTTVANSAASVISANTISLRNNGTFGGGTFDVAAGSGPVDLLVSSILTGNAGLVKTGNGVMVLNGANTYGGGTTIDSGVLQANSGRRLAPAEISRSRGARSNTRPPVPLAWITLAALSIVPPRSQSIPTAKPLRLPTLSPPATAVV